MVVQALNLRRLFWGVGMIATLLTAVGLGFAGLGPAQAAPCGHIHVDVSKRSVLPGQKVLVAGRTCYSRSRRPRLVRIRIHTDHGWRQVGIARTRATGHYARRVPVDVSQNSSETRIQVIASKARSSTRLRLTRASTPVAAASAPATCPLDEPNGVVEETDSACRLVASDTASDPNPLDFWGGADCGTWPDNLEPGRPTNPTTDGDPDPTATGAPQGNSAYRVLTTYDGDDIDGARCELGRNDMDTGPTTFFYEGMRRATLFSERLPENFPLSTPYWQTVFQMKQDQPSQDNGGGPMIEMQAFKNQWVIARDWNIIWTFPAQKNVWTRFAFDVNYSQNPSLGTIQVGADLNGDGDFDDPGERSPKIHGATLSTETAPGYEVPPGGPIPSHIRAGIYHDSRISCPRPVGCSTDLDNLQVLAP